MWKKEWMLIIICYILEWCKMRNLFSVHLLLFAMVAVEFILLVWSTSTLHEGFTMSYYLFCKSLILNDIMTLFLNFPTAGDISFFVLQVLPVNYLVLFLQAEIFLHLSTSCFAKFLIFHMVEWFILVHLLLKFASVVHPYAQFVIQNGQELYLILFNLHLEELVWDSA